MNATQATPNLSLNDIACREHAKLVAAQTAEQTALGLENDAFQARHAGRFDAAAGFESLANAVRTGQLTREQLNTSNRRVRMLGGEALGV